ncbi:WD40 repeat-like protein [Artomyces pyxidatus]|uniref:WD40 repeat-like protein n=1 Tax=Artomyces pyxidatus TaxID=48021 RepID=A0ACB8TCR8_9AGAM|nr:WD40 repeat-like protein [Artomyces pyxidatus]
MVSQTERQLLWNPRGENRFVVGGLSQITLYEWSPGEPAIRHVTSFQDLSSMKCFSWSPDPSIDDLLAIGMNNGRVDLVRLESTRSGREHLQGRGPHVTLPPKVARACISIAFCPTAPQYLAVGLDKARGDASLVIWDIHSATSVLAPHTRSPSASSASHIVAPPPSPVRPLHALPSPTRPYHPIPRTDLGPRTDSRIVQAHAPTESVHSLTWMPQSTQLLAASISHRFLRLFDLRSSSPAIAHVAGRVHSIATDPFDQYRLAAAVDGVVTLWDARKLPTPLLTFSPRDVLADGARSPNASTLGVVELEFSSVRRGMLATLEREASHVQLWNTLRTEAMDSAQERPRSRDIASQSGKPTKLSWSNPTSMLPWSASTGNQSGLNESSSPIPSAPYNLVLSDTRKTKRFRAPLASFALMPSARAHPLTSSLMVVSKDGDLETTSVHDTPMHAPWSARGTLSVAAGTSYRTFSGVPAGDVPSDPWTVVPSVVAPSLHDTDLNRFDGTSPSRRDDLARGRSRTAPGALAPLFGRGDEDGFPALNSPSAKPSPRMKHAHLQASSKKPSKEGTASPLYRSLPGSTAASPHLKANIELPVPSNPSSRASPSPTSTSRRHIGTSKPQKDKETSRARSTGRARRAVDRIQGVVDDDISMVMRRRVCLGYGLSNPSHNATLFRNGPDDETDKSLVETWIWIDLARHILEGPASRSNGYNISNQGLLGIWEGFPSSLPSAAPSAMSSPASRGLLLDPLTLSDADGAKALSRSRSRRSRPREKQEPPSEFVSELLTLGAHRQMDPPLDSAWTGMPTSRPVQRRFALQLCGWRSKDEYFDATIDQWESEGKQSRAACWLVFLGQHSKAVDLLMRSKDESHKMMSGTLVSLTPSSVAKSPELKRQYEKLIMRLEDPYLRAMLTYLALDEWADVLDEDSLPLRERLAIALQFLDDEALSVYLRRIAESSRTHGDIVGIIVTGLTTAGLDLLQSYVDRTGDVQTAAILGAYVHPHQLKDARVERWLDAYRDLLDGWKLFHHRSQFDIERGQILQELILSGSGEPIQLMQRQILVRCNYCNKVISAPQGISGKRATACPFCNRPLPRCSVCLMNLSIVPDSVRDNQLSHHNAALRDTIDDAIVFCQTCRHGGHAAHILEWFYGEAGARSHGVCAVADCDHRCADEF